MPPGTLAERLEDEVEDKLAPGFRNRMLAAYLASLPAPERVQ